MSEVLSITEMLRIKAEGHPMPEKWGYRLPWPCHLCLQGPVNCFVQEPNVSFPTAAVMVRCEACRASQGARIRDTLDPVSRSLIGEAICAFRSKVLGEVEQ